jgi:hypothetical protein
MPGFGRWSPNEEPFTYTKLCNYYLPVLLLIGILLFTAFHGFGWLEQWDKWFPSSFLNVAVFLVIAIAAYFFVLKVVWWLLPASVRARIPYDRREARDSKGDIKSVWDLRKLVRRTRNN